MSGSVSIKLGPGAEELLRDLREMPVDLPQAIARGMNRANELVIGQISVRRLSQRGPETLGVVTNRLRSSIRRTEAVIVGQEIAASIGSNVEYLGVHEFGFNGRVTVRAHSRTTPDRVFGREAKNAGAPHSVRSHSRKVKVTERAPIRRGIAENAPIYEQEIGREIERLLKGDA